MEFRSLRADEIEVRVGQIPKGGSGLSLLLYKDARCDMNLLDEALGAENWQCEYDVINGQLFCKVIVWSESHQQWISKQDVGAPSNMEAEKGRASDAFKRACFKLGIGRELYTAPRIWIYAQNRDGSKNCTIKQGNKGNMQCYDSFSVAEIDVRDHVIEHLAIRNDDTGRIVFEWTSPKVAQRMSLPPTDEQLAEVERMIVQIAVERGVEADVVHTALMKCKPLAQFGTEKIETVAQVEVAKGQLSAWLESMERGKDGK